MSFVSDEVREALTAVSQREETPFFLYDLDSLKQHLIRLSAQTEVKLWYAVKANPLSKVIQTLDSAGFNFDVASTGELEQVLSQDISAERILNTGPAKSRKQIRHFVARGVRTFVAESLNQVQWLNEEAAEQQLTLRVLLRIQLRWPEGEKNPLGGDSLTPFGLGPEQWRELNISHFPALDFAGLHIFQWGNMLSAARLAELWGQMLPPLKDLAQSLGMDMRVLDLGGGLGIPYSNTANPLQWQELVEALSQIKRQAQVDELWMELGRFAVGEYGFYASPVVEQKTNYGQNQLILAGGINHLLRPAVTSQPFPCELLRNSHAAQDKFLIHGPLCTALDSLGEHSLPKDINEHDHLVFSQCGAYGFTESMPYFLCHELPAEYVLENGEIRCVRASQFAADYLR